MEFRMTGKAVAPADIPTGNAPSADVQNALAFLPTVPQDGNLHEVAVFDRPAQARGKANGLNSSSYLIDKAQFVARGGSLYCRVLSPAEGAARVAERDRRRVERRAQKDAIRAEAARL